MNEVRGKIVEINGPIIRAIGLEEAGMYNVVYVGKKSLVGEIIRFDNKFAIIQVYEDNTMMKIGEEVISQKRPLSVLLGPGLLENIYDGIQRPLKDLNELTGAFMAPGTKTIPISSTKKWQFIPTAAIGDKVTSGIKIGYVDETTLIRHYIMIPPNVGSSTIKTIVESGEYTIEDTIATLENGEIIKMAHYWPVRISRPYKEKLPMNNPLITGQRVIDTFFPIARGGTAAIPGGFGTGKTMTQHALAKWSSAKVIVYIGCGERGNEMTDVLVEFPELIDPRTKEPLMKRTILIANTSNMPVAAREVSIYTGVTIAEYFRDMGYDVAVMADSTSRWAEALRELSGRLEEMPAEEGFPAYLPTRLAEFYERAGLVNTLSNEIGSVSIIGAVSPPGGDFSEPVTQHTKRFIRCFWALDKSLANARHYPSISWLDSYSEYGKEVEEFWNNIDEKAIKIVRDMMNLLKTEDRLAQIVKIIGPDSLPDNEKLILLVADMIKKGFLQQNAYDDIDMYSTPEKQILLLKIINDFYNYSNNLIKLGSNLIKIKELGLVDEIVKLKSTIKNDNCGELEKVLVTMREKFDEVSRFYKK